MSLLIYKFYYLIYKKVFTFCDFFLPYFWFFKYLLDLTNINGWLL
jgi:hypothetical protein